MLDKSVTLQFGFKGGGCGVGLGLGWGFGTAFGSQYRSSRVTFQGLEFGSDGKEFKDVSESNQKVRNSQ